MWDIQRCEIFLKFHVILLCQTTFFPPEIFLITIPSDTLELKIMFLFHTKLGGVRLGYKKKKTHNSKDLNEIKVDFSLSSTSQGS